MEWMVITALNSYHSAEALWPRGGLQGLELDPVGWVPLISEAKMKMSSSHALKETMILLIFGNFKYIWILCM